MNPKRFLIATGLFVGMAINLHAQEASVSPQKDKNKEDEPVKHQMNFIKINLMGIALKNYSFQYERIITKRFSLSASYRIMPTGTLPFANTISKSIGDDDPDTKKTVENLRMGNYAITPEARLYLGKGYGKGFYIAAFYRYAHFTMENLPIDYDDTHSLNLSGNLTSNTGGLMFGAQFPMGKHLCLDWWILGAHFGSGTGNFTGVSSQPLTNAQQDELRSNLDDIDIPLTNKTYSVNANGATLKLDGPWGGIRTGLSIGVKF